MVGGLILDEKNAPVRPCLPNTWWNPRIEHRDCKREISSNIFSATYWEEEEEEDEEGGEEEDEEEDEEEEEYSVYHLESFSKPERSLHPASASESLFTWSTNFLSWGNKMLNTNTFQIARTVKTGRLTMKTLKSAILFTDFRSETRMREPSISVSALRGKSRFSLLKNLDFSSIRTSSMPSWRNTIFLSNHSKMGEFRNWLSEFS